MFSRRLLKQVIPFWLLVLIIGSFLPGHAKEAIGTPDRTAAHSLPITNHVALTPHRLYHLLSFGATALLLMLVARTKTGEFGGAFATIVLGVVIEVGQYLSNDFVLEWWDIRDDTIAVIAALLLIQWPKIRAVLVRD